MQGDVIDVQIPQTTCVDRECIQAVLQKLSIMKSIRQVVIQAPSIMTPIPRIADLC